MKENMPQNELVRTLQEIAKHIAYVLVANGGHQDGHKTGVAGNLSSLLRDESDREPLRFTLPAPVPVELMELQLRDRLVDAGWSLPLGFDLYLSTCPANNNLMASGLVTTLSLGNDQPLDLHSAHESVKHEKDHRQTRIGHMRALLDDPLVARSDKARNAVRDAILALDELGKEA